MSAAERLQAITGESAAEWVAIEALRPWKDNPRKNDGEPVRKVAESIQRFGFGAPILARRENGEIIAGHTRWKAAKKLGLDRVPVRYLDLDPADAHLLAVADNRVAAEATWDDAMLAAILADLKAQGHELEATGFDAAELDKLLADATGGPGAEAPEPEISRADELREKWGTEPGQRWLTPSRTAPGGCHVLLCGDSAAEADVARVMGAERAHAMWTDPPYGVAYVGKTKAALTIANDDLKGDALREFLVRCFSSAAKGALKEGSAVYVAHPAGALSLEFLLAFREVGWRLHQTLVWRKDSFVLGHADYHYAHEPILFGYVPGGGRRGRGGEGWYGDNAQSTVFEVPKPRSNDEHPTMKPVELVATMLRNSVPVGGIVYEPFSGSGTTLVAAEGAGRVGRGIEIDPKYVAVALERLSAMGLQPELDAAA